MWLIMIPRCFEVGNTFQSCGSDYLFICCVKSMTLFSSCYLFFAIPMSSSCLNHCVSGHHMGAPKVSCFQVSCTRGQSFFFSFSVSFFWRQFLLFFFFYLFIGILYFYILKSEVLTMMLSACFFHRTYYS